ncbi:DoxX family protein [Gordonia paraffinivorans]|uniref:DoxX family protein n=1 Tax=Gordonia paraffinivorans TaxID=175628 RepID=UPI0014483849|nr:DoxX family protein [Gordonia paraffinivorans]
MRSTPARTIAFRLLFVYSILFCLALSQITIVYAGVVASVLPERMALWQLGLLSPVVEWAGRTFFGVDAVLRNTGSGDQTAFWVLWFLIAAVAVTAAAVWSAVDRRCRDHRRLWAWTVLGLRLALGGQMLAYGFAKLIPVQMAQPPLATLLEPYGEFSPASVLWTQVGSSPVYEMILGSVEVLGGILLFCSRTAVLGALVSFAAMSQVLILNLTFDVPVKILSLQLVVFAAILLAPYARGLADLFVFGRTSRPLRMPPLFARADLNRRAGWVLVILGLWVAFGAAYESWYEYNEYGGGAPKPALYGIWSVGDHRVDGRSLPPLTTDEQRWQRVVFDTNGAVTLQMMDGELVPVQARVDDDRMTIVRPYADLHVRRTDADTLVLTGVVDGTPTAMTAHRLDHDSMTLRSRGFHWIQEEPYFR